VVAAEAERITAVPVGKDASPAGDLALTFSYMKILDPTSTIRESEQASARNARGVPEYVRHAWNNLKKGLTLTPKQREDFRSRAMLMAQPAIAEEQKYVNSFGNMAILSGLSPQNVTIGLYGAESPGSSTDQPVQPFSMDIGGTNAFHKQPVTDTQRELAKIRFYKRKKKLAEQAGITSAEGGPGDAGGRYDQLLQEYNSPLVRYNPTKRKQIAEELKRLRKILGN